MALQYSTLLINTRLDAVETAAGTAPVLKMLSGAMPANCSTVDSGSTVVKMSLPSDWMNGASAGVKTKLGTWQASAVGSGSAGYFRITDSAQAACVIQGLVSQTTASGELIVDSTAVTSGQVVTVNTFTLTGGNA